MAARKSNSVLRAATLLHLLAEDPSSAWSLAEIARRADLSYASAHSVAGALEESGLLRRHPRTRAYTLGPALIALGAAARTRLPRRSTTRSRRWNASRDDLGLGCLASARVGDDMVMLAVTGPPQPFGSRVQVGERRPDRTAARPGVHRVGRRGDDRGLPRPLRSQAHGRGTSPVLWRHSRSCANAGTAWCSTARPVTDSWSSCGHRPISTTLDATTSSTTILVELALDDYALLRRDDDAEYAVTALTAPVFAPDGEVILVLTVVGFAGPLRADALPRYAARMFEATSAIQTAMTA